MWISKDEYNILKRNADENKKTKDNNMMLMRAESQMQDNLFRTYKILCEKNEELYEIKKDLKYYLDTNEENGVVHIPKFIIEKIVYDR